MSQEAREQMVDVEPTNAISAVGSEVKSKVPQSEASSSTDITPATREQMVDVEPTDAISAVGSEVKSKVSQSEASSSTDIAPAAPSCETIPATHSYQIKPLLQDRFKPNVIKEIIRNVLEEKLGGKAYESDKVKKWTVDLSNEISQKVIELKMKRYKHIIQVTLGQHKGAGVKSGVRCMWDSETDGYTSEIFSNDTIFCLVVVYAIYHY